eukprot:1019136-Rhodomonas_salina.3
MLSVAQCTRQELEVTRHHATADQGVSRLLAVQARSGVHGLALDQRHGVRRGLLAGHRPMHVSVGRDPVRGGP